MPRSVWLLALALTCGNIIQSSAQLAGSLTANATVLLSSNFDVNVAQAIRDGNDTTMWQSGACFPTSYITRPEMNALYLRCTTTPSACTGSGTLSNALAATDGSVTTSASVTLLAPSASAWFRITLPSALPITRVGLRGIFSSTAPNTLFVELSSGARLPVLTNASSWTFINVVGNWSNVAALYVNSTVAFSVTELAAQFGACYENATVDLGAVTSLGTIRIRYWPGSTGLASWLLTSTDNVTWTDALAALGQAPLDPTRLGALNVTFPTSLQARYISVRHRVSEADWSKVYVWGIDAFPPPPPPPPAPPAPPPAPRRPPPPPSPGTTLLAPAVTVSSNPDPRALPNIADGDDNTQWQSDACLPTGYTGRPSMNPLMLLCNGSSPLGAPASYCTASAGSSNLGLATDLSVYTGAAISVDPARAAAGVSDGAAFFAATLPGGPRTVTRVSYKGFSSVNVTVVLVVQPTGQAPRRVPVGVLFPPADNYNWTAATGQWQDVVGVRLEAPGGFTLTEVAVQSGPCIEWAMVDMGEIKEVGTLRFRFWSPDAEYSNMSVSADGSNWTVMRSYMNPSLLDAVEIYLSTTMMIRYMKITHKVKEDANWRKVYVWGIDAYDIYGRWGAPPVPSPHPLSLRAMLGVNGIWGWGFQAFSRDLHKAGKGPDYYTAIASWGRNYHGMNWDVKWPTNNPGYETMAKNGTNGQWWLDWDREYVGWKAAGLKVDASFQFTYDVFPASTWGPNVTDTAYKLGFAFGSHFGPGRAPPNVSLDAVEVGNEPWIGYNASFYSALLRGFATGIKDADPTFRLLPCALQASNPYGEDSNNGNFIGARIPPDVSRLLDVVNMHTYSWYRDPEQNNTGLGVHPEHPGSSMNSINNMMAWRNFNMPGKPVWVTEWGWDAHLPGEVCNTTLCVSQHAQALYGIRGLLIMARKGVQVAIWFFYANAFEGSGVFARSGVRGSNATYFVRLPVFDAFDGFLQLVGNKSFLGVVTERTDLFAYLLGPTNATTAAATHLVAWRPVAAGEGPTEPTVASTLTFSRTPVAAWTVSGLGASPLSLSSVVTVAGSTWTIQVSAVPLVVQLA